MNKMRVARELIRIAKELTAYTYNLDLTDIFAWKWVKLLKRHGISTKPLRTSKGWKWKGSGVTVFTSNDPVSGEYYNDKRGREIEPDYASYIEVVGDEDKVMEVVNDIKRQAISIK